MGGSQILDEVLAAVSPPAAPAGKKPNPISWEQIRAWETNRAVCERKIAAALRGLLDLLGEAKWLAECQKEMGWSRTTAYRHLNPDLLEKDRRRAAAVRSDGRNPERLVGRFAGVAEDLSHAIKRNQLSSDQRAEARTLALKILAELDAPAIEPESDFRMGLDVDTVNLHQPEQVSVLVMQSGGLLSTEELERRVPLRFLSRKGVRVDRLAHDIAAAQFLDPRDVQDKILECLDRRSKIWRGDKRRAATMLAAREQWIGKFLSDTVESS